MTEEEETLLRSRIALEIREEAYRTIMRKHNAEPWGKITADDEAFYYAMEIAENIAKYGLDGEQ